MAYRTITQPRTVLFQNFYRSESRSVAFPRPGELEPAVEFWRKAYTVRRRSEVVIHDVRYLDVICLVPMRYVTAIKLRIFNFKSTVFSIAYDNSTKRNKFNFLK